MPSVLPVEVEEIVAMDDRPVLRNLRITQAYHELTLGLREVIGHENVCWSGFACWASKQAGSFIRHEQLPAALRHLVEDPELGLLGALHRALDGVSSYVVLGNKVVFAEMGGTFARFILAFEGDTRPDPSKLSDFLATFAEGPSLPDELRRDDDGHVRHTMRGGQTMLRHAMEALYAAMFEPSPKARAELVLHCNALCGLHEQTRLQPYIVAAHNAPVLDLFQPWIEGQDRRTRLAEQLARLVRDLTTELMMTMRVPGQTLPLGRDLEAPPGERLWPDVLVRLERPELVALTRTLLAYETREASLDWSDRVEDWLDLATAAVGLGRVEAQGTGARDWSSLPQRMRFIFELFRSRQQHRRIFEPPFTAEQVAALRRGEVPAGAL